MIDVRIGDSRKLIHDLADKSIDCVVTSPPYWGLRDYGHRDQIGLEATLEEYLKTMLDFFDDVKLKLKDEGNCFVNLGDTYSGSGNGIGSIDPKNKTLCNANAKAKKDNTREGVPAKCLCMIPQRFAWGMINPNWELREDLTTDEKNYVISELINRGVL